MDQQHPTTQETRLRPHPANRAIGDSQMVDIAAALQQLRDESHPAVHGHRQITIFHQAPVTMVLFAFDADGSIPDHVAHGMVEIHVIDGSLTVQVQDSEHVLQAHQILVLNPDVAHSVRANQASAMLLTIQLVGKKALQPTS